MTIDLEVQNASKRASVPDTPEFERWLVVALAGHGDVSLAIRVVDANEMRALNSRYRGRDEPTNVLSFPAELPPAVKGRLDTEPLGDIVICAPVVEAEAERQGKAVSDHWAHLTIHGLLHLLGHDHQEADEAEAMEALEVEYLANLSIPNPYHQ